jgi:hypothetical protein
LGIGDWGLGPIPNPQSPIPNPQSPIPILAIRFKYINLIIFINYLIAKTNKIINVPTTRKHYKNNYIRFK